LYRRSLPGSLACDGANFLNGPSNTANKALLEERLLQNMPHTCSRSPCRDIFVRVTRDEDDRCGNVAIPQTASQIDAVYIRHFVIDHEAVDAGRTDRVEQRRAVPEGSDGESIRFKKKPQRTENVRVVVDHVDRRFGGRRHHDNPCVLC